MSTKHIPPFTGCLGPPGDSASALGSDKGSWKGSPKQKGPGTVPGQTKSLINYLLFDY